PEKPSPKRRSPRSSPGSAWGSSLTLASVGPAGAAPRRGKDDGARGRFREPRSVAPGSDSLHDAAGVAHLALGREPLDQVPLDTAAVLEVDPPDGAFLFGGVDAA